MNTTNYILELLISGITSLTWIILLYLTLLGNENVLMELDLKTTHTLLILFILAPFSYIFGTISDRVAEIFYDAVLKRDNCDIKKKKKKYREIRTQIYLKSEKLTDLYEYGKLRVRICRSWIFNGTLIFLVVPFYMYSDASPVDEKALQLYSTIFFEAILLLSIIGANAVINELNGKECDFLTVQKDL